MNNKCPICALAANNTLVGDAQGYAYRIECPRCGSYLISDLAVSDVEMALAMDQYAIRDYAKEDYSSDFTATKALCVEVAIQDRILNKYAFLLFIFLSLFLSNDAIAEVREKVDIELGLHLAESIYPHAGIGVPKKRNETFLIYQVLGKYEGTAAWLAVNPWTGDVWDMNECKLLSNAALQKAQARIKKQFSTKELTEYERLHNIKPYREYDLEPCP